MPPQKMEGKNKAGRSSKSSIQRMNSDLVAWDVGRGSRAAQDGFSLFAMDLVPGEMGWCARVTSRKLSLRYSLHLSNILYASRVGDSLFDGVSRWPLHMAAEPDSSKLPGQLYQPRRHY